MPERVTANRLTEFIDCLQAIGGSCGNGRLREALKWEEDFYWKVQGKLIEQGRIVPGRGRGGSIRLTGAESGSQTEASQPAAEDVALPATVDEQHQESNGRRRRRSVERPLYDPIKTAVENHWIARFGFDHVLVEETHSRGSKDTGGTFTRPDITVAGIRRYVFLPPRLEIITFEIKPADAVGIMGVLEAIAHREAAHRSYVMYAVGRTTFDSSAEAERISELAQKFGVGVVLTEDPAAVDTWEILLESIRHEPDPARLDRFLGDLPSDSMKSQLQRWIR